MAARKTRTLLSDDWREKIKTSMLLNRLQENAFSKTEIMSSGQIKSAEILLRKVIPDLKAVELTGAEGGPLIIEVLIAPHADNPRQD
jgi:septum formation inhibitor-activating ATPase MinD